MRRSITTSRKIDAPPIGDHLLTLREAADVLRLSTRTVREYVSRGDIEGRIWNIGDNGVL